MFSLRLDLHPEVCVVIRGNCVTENLYSVSVVHSGDGLHEMAGGMIPEIGRDISHLQTSAMSTFGMSVDGLMEDRYFLHAQLGVPGCDSFPLLMTERIQHGVMGMDGRKPLLLQLIVHNRHQLLHPLLVVAPVADYL